MSRPVTDRGLALVAALRQPRKMPDSEVDWSAWIASIERQAVVRYKARVARAAAPPVEPRNAAAELVPYTDEEVAEIKASMLPNAARTSWRKASRALHSSGDDEPYATDRKDGAS